MKLCKDCKHYSDNSKNAIEALLCGVVVSKHLCSHPELVNPITGSAVDAAKNRAIECGKEGRFWEASHDLPR